MFRPFLPLAGSALALLLLATSCQLEASQAPSPRHYGAVSFSCPAGWHTDAAEHTDSAACSVSCSKTGFNTSGLVSMSWFTDSLDQEKLQGIFRQQLRSSPVYKTASIHFEPVQPGSYGNRPAQVGSFSFSLLGVAHAGAIYTFWQPGHTFAVLTQQALEDSAANRAGFQLLAQSLQCRLAAPAAPPTTSP